MYPRKDATFMLDVDASLYSIGACLSQHDENGDERPIAYSSRVLSKSQQNYCASLRELLALVVFLRHYHHYLYGREFILRTDCSSLTWLMRMKESSGMLARWLTTIGTYRFTTVHRKGKLHDNADALSRLPGVGAWVGVG